MSKSHTLGLELTIRHFVYEHFVENLRPPTVSETAAAHSLSIEQTENIYRQLHENHFLFLVPGTYDIRMANPFAAQATGFRVHTNGRTYHATCAWDMLGIPAALHSQNALIEATCGDCTSDIQIRITEGKVQDSGEIVHFLLPFREWYDDLVFT